MRKKKDLQLAVFKMQRDQGLNRMLK